MKEQDPDPVPPDEAKALPPADVAQAPAPKPKRAPRRKPAAAVAPEDAVPGTGAAAAVASESAAPAAEVPPAVALPDVMPPAAMPSTAVQPAAEPAVADAAVMEPAGAAEGPVPAAGGAGVPREGAPRRKRNRRRGRGGDRSTAPPGAAEGVDAIDDEATGDGEASPVPAALPAVDPREVFAEVLSGAFDAEAPEAEGAPAAGEPTRRILAPEPDAPKLHKVLAQAGIGSRREMEQLIVEGRITVNGEPAHIGQRISYGDRIAVAGRPIKVRISPPPPRVLAYHKPAGEVVTHDDPQHRPTVFRRLPRLPQGKWQSVGRLDINTEGLLLFTNSGELANQLMHPRFGVEREYAVRSLGTLDEEQLARLLEGVEIDGQRAAFKSIEDGGGEGANHWYRVVITEGRNREVRKLFEAVGHAVSRLIRIRYGCVVLPRGLRRGVWVDLPEGDVRALRRLAGGERERDAEGGGRNKRRRGQKSRDHRGREGGDRGPRPERAPRAEGEGFAIPNPLQQTFDRRAIQQARQTRRELPEDGPIPNPLQQTYDKRALQRDRQQPRELPEDGPIPNPLQQTFDKRFVQKGSGRGGGGRAGGARGGSGSGGGGKQPDPMQTSVGYIGADAFRNKGGGRGGGRGGRGGRGR